MPLTEDCKKAIEVDPSTPETFPETYENLTFALFKTGQFQEALEYCNKSIELDPSSDTVKKLLEDINKVFEL